MVFCCFVEMVLVVFEVHNNLGNVLKEKGDWEGVEVVLWWVVEFNFEYVNVFYNLGSVLIE